MLSYGVFRLRSRLGCSIVLAACSAACHLASTHAPVSEGSPQRIISVVPSATETLFAFGLADRVIAVGDYDRLPPEAGDRPRIGGLLNPNLEKIIEFKPDLVITYGSQAVLQERLQALGIRIYPFTHGGVEHTLQYMLDLGSAVGVQEKAQETIRRIRNAFDDVRAHAPAVHPKILLVHNRGIGTVGSFYSVGARAFQHELIIMAGGVNVFGDVDKEVIQPTLEEVIAREPDIILETLPSTLGSREAEQRKEDWKALPKTPALTNGRVYIIGDDDLLVPGPRLDRAARRLAEIIGK